MELKSGLKALFHNKGINPDETIAFLLAIKHDLDVSTSDDIYRVLSKNKYIDRDHNSGKIVCLIGLYEGEEGIELDDSIYNEVERRIDEYRRLFKSVRTGGMGNKRTCIDDISKYCATNDKSFDDILEVTQWYLQNAKLPCNADNFIYHTDPVSGKIKSRIETIFDEYQNQEETWKTI